MKTPVPFLVLLFSFQMMAHLSFCQSSEGIELMENNEFESAIPIFENDLSHKTKSIFANYSLAKIYSDSTYLGFDLEKAWGYFLAFDSSYKAMNSKKKEKFKKKFKIKSSRLKNFISESAMDIAIQKNTVQDFDHFLETFAKAKLKYRNEIAMLRNQLAFDEAEATNSSAAFEVFLEKYKKSLKSKSPKLWKAGQLRFFEIAMKESKWKSFDSFSEKNPTNPYIKDSAVDKYRAIHPLKDKIKYIDFIESSPRSLHTKFAKNQVARQLVQKGTTDEFNWFLLSFPEHEAANDLWKNFFYHYIGKFGEDSSLDFMKNYPQYPFPEDLAAVVKEAKIRSQNSDFEKIEFTENAFLILDFLQKYPESDFAPVLQSKLLRVLKEHPSIHVYEKFISLKISDEVNNQLVSELYGLYTHDLSYDGLKDFIDKYGDIYPDSARVRQDLLFAEQFIGIIRKGYTPDSEFEYDAFIKAAAPHEAAYVALSKTIENDLSNKNWTTARRKVENYQSYFKDQSIPYTQLLNTLKSPSKNVRLTKLNSGINTEGSEYAPVISADGRTLYYCGKNREDNIGREDIFISNKKNSKWSQSTPVRTLNTITSNEAPEAISVDGTKMLMFSNGKLCESNQTENGWSNVSYLPKTINAAKWQGDASISSDGRALLFVSAREDIIGFQKKGNLDIYVCLKNENGEWDQVLNLGHQVNTPYMDRSPFLHPDMKTLYFSSAGHGGFGLMDVYKTTRLDDSWTNWSEPINLGREINTPGSDWGYKVSTDGATAYFSFAPEGSKSEDIYQVELPVEMRPDPVSTIAGVLTDSKGLPVDAEIIIEDLTSRKIVAELKSNPVTGAFFVVLPGNRKYSYFIKKENYFPIANNIDLRGNRTEEIKANLKMLTVAELTEKGISITLENIFFDTDKFELKPESYSELDRVFSIIQSNNFMVELYGHTDSDGEQKYNLQLSQNRADAVKNYLVKKGIPFANISAIGKGETMPIDNNNTKKGKAKNRRVELKFKFK